MNMMHIKFKMNDIKSHLSELMNTWHIKAQWPYTFLNNFFNISFFFKNVDHKLLEDVNINHLTLKKTNNGRVYAMCLAFKTDLAATCHICSCMDSVWRQT
jgi:hypothetical protein